MALKLRFRPLFPANVQVASPLVLVKTGSLYSFSFDATGYQPIDATLTALAAIDSTAGLLVQTAVDTFTKRTLTGTANEITATNGDGVLGNPTLSLPAAMTLAGKTVTGGTFAGGLWNKITFTAPATSATLTLVDGTTVTGPAATGTLVTKTSTDALTNKTFNTAATGNVFQINGTTITANVGSGSNVLHTSPGFAGSPALNTATAVSINGATVSPGHYSGEPSNGNAVAGEIGENIQSNIPVGSAVVLTTATPANLTSISLTAGDWEVTLIASINPAATTSVVALLASISQTSATRDLTTGGAASDQRFAAVVPASPMSTMVGPLRISLASTTTIYGVVQSNFTVSTNAAYGILRARRVR